MLHAVIFPLRWGWPERPCLFLDPVPGIGHCAKCRRAGLAASYGPPTVPSPKPDAGRSISNFQSAAILHRLAAFCFPGLRFFELVRVLVCLNHVARFKVNANDGLL